MISSPDSSFRSHSQGVHHERRVTLGARGVLRGVSQGWVEKVGEVTLKSYYLPHTIKSHTQQREKAPHLAHLGHPLQILEHGRMRRARLGCRVTTLSQRGPLREVRRLANSQS